GDEARAKTNPARAQDRQRHPEHETSKAKPGSSPASGRPRPFSPSPQFPARADLRRLARRCKSRTGSGRRELHAEARGRELVQRKLEFERHDLEDRLPLGLVSKALAQHPFGVLAISEELDDLVHLVVRETPE